MFNTITVAGDVTPTVLETLISHNVNRKQLHQKPTAHTSYHVGLRLIKQFLIYASHHTVEELQAFTAQYVPNPRWVRLEDIDIPAESLLKAAQHIQAELGEDGLKLLGGKNWWQWRRDKKLRAEWIEMRKDFNARKRANTSSQRIMLYIHGGGYFFGSVDEHRYQMQRHARKLGARVLAPRYRLAPQFPFPCGLMDCLAVYLWLLTVQPPETIILAGDSAGGGMSLALLCLLRNQGLPLPAGAVLISPWVDLTHSFPSLSGPSNQDYIPAYGFHHRFSMAWPPPNTEELKHLHGLRTGAPKASDNEPKPPNPAVPTYEPQAGLSIELDGKVVEIQDQIQMYAANWLVSHPLVSPALQPSLGGLPPLLIMTGGGELLRDEQIYVAHKAANPSKYPPSEAFLKAHPELAKQVSLYGPTNVQLQVWEDLCHVAPTLSFTRPAKFMFRSIAQFGAWALARAQKTEITIVDDDDISIISSVSSDSTSDDPKENEDGTPKVQPGDRKSRKDVVERDGTKPATSAPKPTETPLTQQVGKAGDPLPNFSGHMIRQRVGRHGEIFPLEPASELPGCTLPPDQVGVIKEGPVRTWLRTRAQWDVKYTSAARRVREQRQKEFREEQSGIYTAPDGTIEVPVPSALAGRPLKHREKQLKKQKKSRGLMLWTLFGSKHDEEAIENEEKRDEVDTATTDAQGDTTETAVTENEDVVTGTIRPRSKKPKSNRSGITSISRSRIRYMGQIEEEGADAPAGIGSPTSAQATPISPATADGAQLGLLASQRPAVGQKAFPFKLAVPPHEDERTASMVTLTGQSGIVSMVEDGEKESTPTSTRPAGPDRFVTATDDLPTKSDQ